MNTTTTTTRSGRQVAVTTVTMIEPIMYEGVEVDRVICETRTYDGDENTASTYYHLSNGQQYVGIWSARAEEIIKGGC